MESLCLPSCLVKLCSLSTPRFLTSKCLLHRASSCIRVLPLCHQHKVRLIAEIGSEARMQPGRRGVAPQLEVVFECEWGSGVIAGNGSLKPSPVALHIDSLPALGLIHTPVVQACGCHWAIGPQVDGNRIPGLEALWRNVIAFHCWPTRRFRGCPDRQLR